VAKKKQKPRRKSKASKRMMTVLDVFSTCVTAIRDGRLISRESAQDKEFHFQNWFKSRLQETKLNFEEGGRNSYPDFRIVKYQDGYEVKGLAYPGRDATFDSNSQIPTGVHNGRQIYYVFGRYPAKPDGNKYPVVDLVICHGDFLNADHEYKHENKSVRSFGSYGDIMIRDRKMYVVPTPFHLAEGTAHQHTLILPSSIAVGKEFVLVGDLTRSEAEELVVGYAFNLKTNDLVPQKVKNPEARKRHSFRAWRLKGSKPDAVTMRSVEQVKLDLEKAAKEDE
jgi:hypothetical protein